MALLSFVLISGLLFVRPAFVISYESMLYEPMSAAFCPVHKLARCITFTGKNLKFSIGPETLTEV